MLCRVDNARTALSHLPRSTRSKLQMPYLTQQARTHIRHNLRARLRVCRVVLRWVVQVVSIRPVPVSIRRTRHISLNHRCRFSSRGCRVEVRLVAIQEITTDRFMSEASGACPKMHDSISKCDDEKCSNITVSQISPFGACLPPS